MLLFCYGIVKCGELFMVGEIYYFLCNYMDIGQVSKNPTIYKVLALRFLFASFFFVKLNLN